MGFSLRDIFGGLVKPLSDAYTKKQDRAIAKESAKAKIAMKKVDGEHEVVMTDAEWEALAKTTEDNTWKDEYVTVIITMWMPLIFLGAIVSTVTGDSSVMDGVNLGLQQIKETGIDMGDLTYVVVLAAVGLKVWRGK